eukprot:TRINITY_DN23206_c0_g2_i1.p1 TRINITY_DN23206_c0_g2~~TRINITY_DN23206_c0_g2_i1.p1  ORF type:complete len:461 (+),score=52.32 TRINITY_DN23206_c0_g2_i1:71-1453(+)
MSIPPGTGDGNPVAFHKGLVELQERCDVFHDVLLASGLMGPQELQMRLHRRRFNAIRRRHPCVWQQSLSDTIANTSVAIHVENFMHLSTIHTVRSASTAFRSNFANRTHPVELGKLYWCSSTETSCQTSQQLWQSYDLTSNTWDTLPCPCNLQRPRNVVGGCGSVYLCGQECLWHRYDAALRTWQQLPPMPSGRSDCNGALLEVVCGKLYACGGSEEDGIPVHAMERYDPRENVWEELPRFSDVRVEFAWSVVRDKLYVCGGIHYGDEDPLDPADWPEGGRLLNQLERYDAEGNVWEQLPGMTTCSGACSAVGLEGCLFVVGGIGTELVETSEDDGRPYVDIVDLDAAECFRPKDRTWTALPPMRKGRQSPRLATSRGCLYVWTASSLERFDPAVGSWEEVACRASAYWLRGSLILGSLYVFGEFLWQDFKRIARFNTVTGSWEEIALKSGLGAFATLSG